MSEIQLYETIDGTVTLDVRTDAETVWLSADQLVTLFGRDKSVISRHLRNVFAEAELDRESVVAVFATTAADGKAYRVAHYNLDVVISVGYRVRSTEGVRFRQWATRVLRRYLIEGAAVNDRRLDEIGKIVHVLSRSVDPVMAGVADVLTEYLPSLQTLRDYDEGTIEPRTGSEPTWVLTHDDARSVIAQVRSEFPADTLFGNERGGALAGVIDAIYQTFGGHQLYPTMQEQAANLLYLVIKDHPLSDGNKRSAAALFVHFLAHNDGLVAPSGRPRISNNALAAITLMVAMSDPKEKELMIALLVRMLTDDD
jgi:prophage maintenance system killer protein